MTNQPNPNNPIYKIILQTRSKMQISKAMAF